MKRRIDIAYLMQPKDRSVDAYRDYISKISLATAGKKFGGDLRPEDWKKKCDEFWRDYDARHPGQAAWR